MDLTSGNSILNPSELDVTLTGDGSMTLVPGINRKAVQFDGLRGHVAVATRGFGFDCFGDFDKCTAGKRTFKNVKIGKRCDPRNVTSGNDLIPMIYSTDRRVKRA